MPSFYWGTAPLPDSGEYFRRQDYYDLIYSLPYYLAGLVITFIGLVISPLILRGLPQSQSHIFRNSATMTLVLLLLLPIASDLGARRGPIFVLHQRHDILSLWALCLKLVPACILSGAAAVGARWRSTRPFRTVMPQPSQPAR